MEFKKAERRKPPSGFAPRTCSFCASVFIPDHAQRIYCKPECRDAAREAKIAAITEKRCGSCGVVKPVDDFHRCGRSEDGRSYECKPCASYSHSIRYRANADRIKAQSKAWREANPEAFIRAKRAYYGRNTAQVKARAARWCREHKDEMARYATLRRTREAGNGGSHTAGEWKASCEEAGFRCLCCGEEKPLTRDHIIPVERGGGSDIGNIQPLCLSCNVKKGTQIIDYRATDRSSHAL